MDLGLVLFNVNFALLVTVLTLTDAIEYGQLKIGQRNEAVVLAVRPMIDKYHVHVNLHSKLEPCPSMKHLIMNRKHQK